MYGISKIDTPETLGEALEILAQSPNAQPYAGGTDILVKMRSLNTQGAHFVSLSKIDELHHIYEDDTGLHIGPMVSFAELVAHPLITTKIPLLRTAALAMGGPQVQNLATIGGNLCNGATSSDSSAPLLALDAVLVLQSNRQKRTIELSSFYVGPGKVNCDAEELLVDIIIPTIPNEGFGSVYEKFSTRKAMDIATLGCASAVWLNPNKSIRKARLAYCTAGPTPVRCFEVETLLEGKSDLNAELLEEAIDLAVAATNPRSSWRASKDFRLNLIRELGKRNLMAAFQMAGARQ